MQRRSGYAVEGRIVLMSCDDDDDMASSFPSVFLAASAAHKARLYWGDECPAVGCQSPKAKHLIISSLSTFLILLSTEYLLPLVELFLAVGK